MSEPQPAADHTEPAPAEAEMEVADKVEIKVRAESSASASARAAPLEVAFQSIFYSVPARAPNPARSSVFSRATVPAERTILRNVSGIFRPGRLTAVLGSSGAGKSTLLDVLCGEARAGTLAGSVRVNGAACPPQTMRRLAGCVPQQDVVLATQTVREAVLMSALLRLPARFTRAEREQRVDAVLATLGLRHCAHTRIGDTEARGVSGGERKRVAIGMELVTNPSMLFLDEPTSGLDTFTAFSVIRCLKKLALAGRTVVATVHQPSSEIFALFDDVLILSEGQVVYAGARDLVIPYFSAHGFICPRYTNPSDFIFMSVLNSHRIEQEEKDSDAADNEIDDDADILSVYSNPYEHADERLQRVYRDWRESGAAEDLYRSLKRKPVGTIDTSAMKTTTGFMTQVSYLLGRASKNVYRNPLIIQTKLVQTLFTALLIGLVYLGTGERTGQAAIQDRIGVLFLLSVNNVFASCVSVLSIFGQEKQVFAREFGAGYYTLPAYFLSKIGVEVPLQVLWPLIQAGIVYPMVGLQNDIGKFLVLVSITVLCSLSGFSLGVFMASVFSSLPVALSAAPFVLMPLMLFSGLFINDESIPVYFSPIKYISPIKYGFEGLVKNEFEGLRIDPGAIEESHVPMMINGTAVQPPPLPFMTGESVIDKYGFGDDGLPIELCAALLAAITLSLVALAYAGLHRVVAEKRRTARVVKSEES